MLLNLIKYQPDMDKIYLYIKDRFESKYQLLMDWREKVGFKRPKALKAFIDYLQTIDDVYENLEDFAPTKKRRVLIEFDDMTADTEFNKKIKFYCYRVIFRRKKAQYFTCFYITILLQST